MVIVKNRAVFAALFCFYRDPLHSATSDIPVGMTQYTGHSGTEQSGEIESLFFRLYSFACRLQSRVTAHLPM